jgi:hypothetical protein
LELNMKDWIQSNGWVVRVTLFHEAPLDPTLFLKNQFGWKKNPTMKIEL